MGCGREKEPSEGSLQEDGGWDSSTLPSGASWTGHPKQPRPHGRSIMAVKRPGTACGSRERIKEGESYIEPI